MKRLEPDDFPRQQQFELINVTDHGPLQPILGKGFPAPKKLAAWMFVVTALWLALGVWMVLRGNITAAIADFGAAGATAAAGASQMALFHARELIRLLEPFAPWHHPNTPKT